ncbi:MAG TPA: hypothetical protein P5055_11755 [Candidatus Paceibacterota bacterium]|nr:hypothetical protein [Candidatus Paceibacterota bacterium]
MRGRNRQTRQPDQYQPKHCFHQDYTFSPNSMIRIAPLQVRTPPRQEKTSINLDAISPY